MYKMGRKLPRGVPYKEKYVFFFTRGQISRADRRENVYDGRTVSHTWVSSLLVAIS